MKINKHFHTKHGKNTRSHTHLYVMYHIMYYTQDCTHTMPMKSTRTHMHIYTHTLIHTQTDQDLYCILIHGIHKLCNSAAYMVHGLCLAVNIDAVFISVDVFVGSADTFR